MSYKINENVLLAILVMVLVLNFLMYAKSIYVTNVGDTLEYALLFLIFATLVVQSIVLLRIADNK
ncbi:MAG: hypothetical protein DRN66_03060 [Candidatus Nanohalarchaeota archaeon]|nr:MAG: hypothetical protein DRN66_03060 [Candidatus Nanohaloarchaeota archaeon]